MDPTLTITNDFGENHFCGKRSWSQNLGTKDRDPKIPLKAPYSESQMEPSYFSVLNAQTLLTYFQAQSPVKYYFKSNLMVV